MCLDICEGDFMFIYHFLCSPGAYVTLPCTGPNAKVIGVVELLCGRLDEIGGIVRRKLTQDHAPEPKQPCLKELVTLLYYILELDVLFQVP